MFEINSSYRIDTSIPIITGNYEVLHFDELPILFSGTNKYGNKLIGSFCDESEDGNIYRYFINLVSDKTYSDFYSSRLSYLEVIMQSNELFIIDRDYKDEISATYHLPVRMVPEDYLPHYNAYIPERSATVNRLSFSFSLKGKLADLHKSLVLDVNSVSQRIYNYLEDCLNALPPLEFRPQIYSQPSETGSYRLNYDIELKEEKQKSLFPLDQKELANFFNSYLRYIAQSLPNESDDFIIGSGIQSKQFDELKDTLIKAYEASYLAPSAAIHDRLSDNVNSSASKLADVTNYLKNSESFSSIEVGHKNRDGEFNSFIYLDESYSSKIQEKLALDDFFYLDSTVESDAEPRTYRILVYLFNTDTGKGGARLYYDDTENFFKIKLNVEKGDKDLSKSKFTDSLHENKVVEVKGIAARVNGIYKKLDCYL